MPGYRFSGWTGDYTSKEEEILISSDTDMYISAMFSPEEPVKNLVINELLTSNSGTEPDEFGELSYIPSVFG